MASYEQAKALLSHSVSRRTLYSIKIHNVGRNGVTDPDRDLTSSEKEYLKLYASRISMPGVSTKAMTALGQENMGIFRATPNEIRHGTNQLSIEVIENSDFIALDMMRKLFDQMAVNSNPRGSDKNIRMRYYNSYVRDITVDKLEYSNGPIKNPAALSAGAKNDLDFGYKRVARYKFEKCYVNSIGEYSLDSGAFNDYLSFGVVFAFESFYYKNKKVLNDGRD